MGNVKSLWSKGEEEQETANSETSTSSTFDVKTVSEEVVKTEKANVEASRKKKRKTKKNKKPASGVTLNPHKNVEYNNIANCEQQDTNMLSDIQFQVKDGQRIATNIVRSLSEELTIRNMGTLNSIGVKTISEEVEKTEKANGEVSRKKKRKTKKNKKLATGVILNPHNNVEDIVIANCGQQDTNMHSDVQSQVNDDQQKATNIVRSPSEKLTVGHVENLKNIEMKTVFEELEKTEKSNGEASRKKKRKTKKNKKLDTGVILNPHKNVEGTEIANCWQQDTHRLSDVHSQVKDGQRIATIRGGSLSDKLTTGNVETPNNKNFVTRSKKMLLILDVNGLLVEVLHPPPKDCKPDMKISKRAIFKRPFLDDFLGFCFERFDVAIWSSRTRKILDPVVDYLLGDWKKKLVFLWDLSHCTSSSARSLENHYKLIVFKKLGKIWEEKGLFASENGYYDESNTLLLDDSPYKALLNPKHTGIFPLSYRHEDINDNSLGPDGDLRIYLEGVAASENVKTYVERHPFGQRPIDETSPDWAFYSKVLKKVF